ncbi:unnamed protein product [Adineta steineri]|uniref:G-protein coupled receptors family 1 profile domain-containing protein n=1 Tax=Adineta steineri TaxID=433720 RepID=A0A814QT22_9BILA|nr:unnamed protein product [Adineta steineri]CAF1122448.1 unnamed protein product [Adineta steineri]
MSSALIHTYLLSSVETNSLLLSHVRTIIKFYIWPLLVLFGLTGNCLSILVLTRRRLIRTSTNNYLTILALFDSCYLIFTLLLNFASHPKFSQYSFTQTLLYLLRPLADFSSNTATWLIVCFTLERTLAVAKPIYAKRTCSVRRSRRVICTLLIMCFLVTLPTFFERNLVREDHNNDITETNNLLKHKDFFLHLHRVYLVFICIVIIWIPLLVLCVCNSILIWYVHRSRHFDDDIQSSNTYDSDQNSSSSVNKTEYSTTNRRRSSSSSVNISNSFQLRRHSRSVLRKRRVTIVLIFCLSVALLLWTPQSLSLTYETLIENYSNMSEEHRVILLIFNNFANLFLCINASIDLILYCFLSEKFARTCRQIICRQCSNNPTQIGPRPRLMSIDRTSYAMATSPTNHQQQQLAANRTNKYYVQLYDFYRNSSGLKKNENKKWKKKVVRTIAPNTKCDNQIFYQKNLSNNKQKIVLFKSYNKSTNIIPNPVLVSIDENTINNDVNDSINTLPINSNGKI